MAFLAWCIINDAEGTFNRSIIQHFYTETRQFLAEKQKLLMIINDKGNKNDPTKYVILFHETAW
jgi:hypothetical protein